MRQKILIFILFLLILTELRCFTTTDIPLPQNSKNITQHYIPSGNQIHPVYKIYHLNDSTTVLYFKIYLTELLFSMANEENIPKAKVKIQYQTFESFENMWLIDSASTYINLKNPSQKEFFSFITLKSSSLKKYMAQIIVSDLNRKARNVMYLSIYKTTKTLPQNFLPVLETNQSPLFSQYFKPSTNYVIKNEQHLSKNYFIRYFSNDIRPATPPFSSEYIHSEKLNFDTVFQIQGNPFPIFNFKTKGHFLIQTDTTNLEGFLLFYRNEHYPMIKTVNDMLPPLQYLTSSKEFDSLFSAENKKLSLDNFWLKAGGSVEKSREMIKIFYNRVLFANIFFTSYTEGWKTDRGMIYTVFGPPKSVYRNDLGEQWNYSGTGKTFSTLTFSFKKVESPYCENDFRLIRNITYKTSWTEAVESWRKGQVISL